MSIEDDADFHFWRAADLFDEQPSKALAHLETALAREPNHQQALVLLGELYIVRAQELGLEPAVADQSALGYFEQVLVREPKHAEAWSRKALTLLYLDRPEEALQSAEQGLSVLASRAGYGMEFGPVHTNVAEALFDVKIRALMELGCPNAVRQTLFAGLVYCPGSKFLTRHVEAVTPLFHDSEAA